MVPLTSKLRRFSRCSFLRMTKAATPQKVYPPWASMPGTPPMPPSQFWHLRWQRGQDGTNARGRPPVPVYAGSHLAIHSAVPAKSAGVRTLVSEATEAAQ